MWPFWIRHGVRQSDLGMQKTMFFSSEVVFWFLFGFIVFLGFWIFNLKKEKIICIYYCTLQCIYKHKSLYGSKFLTYLSTFKRLHFGMLYHTIFALIFLNLILFCHYLLLNSTSSWKLTFFFIPILLSLSSLYCMDWPLGTLICPVCHSLFIPYPLSSIRSSAQLVLILYISYSVSE